MASNIKKVLGIMNKKKPDDLEDEGSSYTDPALYHSTEPPKSHRGLPPHYPPPRPQHSPNPQRKFAPDTTATGIKRVQTNDNKRNSEPLLATGEPRRAPPRPNIAKKNDDDYCDPVDVQRKEDFVPDKSDRVKDDYCEPWDSTTKPEFKNVSQKRSELDDEYMDPYNSGKQGIIEKRMSRGLSKNGGKPLNNDQQKKSVADTDQVCEPSKNPTADDYDMPWEWKKNMNKLKVPRPISAPSQNQRPKPGSAPRDNYDEPWENKQGYLLGAGKSRSPAPLPRHSVAANQEIHGVYDKPWDPTEANDSNIPVDHDPNAMYEIPWDNPNANQINGSKNTRDESPRRASQPSIPSSQPVQNRKSSQPVISNSTNYDTPWEYKSPKQFGSVAPPKPSVLLEASEVNPDLPLDSQSWYHGSLKRLQAEELLRDAPDCSYLVRNSESSKKDFSLSMKNNDNFLHLKIVRQIDGQFILGQFSKPFMDIPKVISHYSKNKLNIRGAEHKFLMHPVSAQPEYHTIEPGDSQL